MKQHFHPFDLAQHLRRVLLTASAAMLLAACGSTQRRGAATPDATHSTPAAASASNVYAVDSLVTLRGRVVVAHEVRAFTPEGDSTEYWVVDPSGALEREYERVSGGATDGTPLRAELELRYKGYSDEGFAAEYDGVFEVVRIHSMEREPESKR